MYNIRHRITPSYMQVGGLGQFGSGRRVFPTIRPRHVQHVATSSRSGFASGRFLGELVPPAQSGSGATLIDFGRDLLATAGTIYLAKNQIDPTKYAPTVRVQVDPGQQTQTLGRNALIVATVAAAGIVGVVLLTRKRR